MKIIKLLVQIETPNETRWLLRLEDIARKLAIMFQALIHCWTEGPEPRVTVIPEEKFFVDPDTASVDKHNLNWQDLAYVDRLRAVEKERGL